jgi:hypothetical protein
MKDIEFAGGSYAIRVASGIPCPWGTSWDDLGFGGGLTVGAMDWSAGASATPNNHFGRMRMSCNNMTGPVFQIRGYNFVIDTLEFLTATNAQLMQLADGSSVDMGSIKLEVGTYTASTKLFQFVGAAKGRIGSMTLDSTTVAGAGVRLSCINVTGGTVETKVGNMALNASVSGGAVCVAVEGGPVRIDQVSYVGGTQLVDNGSTADAETTIVTSQVRGAISENVGNVTTYNVVQGGPNILTFNTTLTAPLTVNLPSFVNNLFNGLWYELVFNGAINGANTATIKDQSGSTLLVQSVDNVIVRCVYRRNTGFTVVGKYAAN